MTIFQFFLAPHPHTRKNLSLTSMEMLLDQSLILEFYLARKTQNRIKSYFRLRHREAVDGRGVMSLII